MSARRRRSRGRVVAAVWLTVLALPGLVGPAAAAEPGAPAAASAVAVVQAFYAYHFRTDQGFSAAAVRRRATWLAPDLLAAFRAYFARPVPKDEVPPIDGDPFTDSQDSPLSFKVGQAAVAGATTRVPVTLAWSASERRVITVVLVASGRSWKISDIAYEAGSTLRGLLSSPP